MPGDEASFTLEAELVRSGLPLEVRLVGDEVFLHEGGREADPELGVVALPHARPYLEQAPRPRQHQLLVVDNDHRSAGAAPRHGLLDEAEFGLCVHLAATDGVWEGEGESLRRAC